MARTFTSDQIAISRTATLEPAQITCAMWFRSAGRSGNFKYLFEKVLTTGEHASYAWHTTGGGGNFLCFEIGWGTSAGNTSRANCTTDLYNGAWRHVAGTYDLSDIRMYLDGAESSTAAENRPIAYNASNDLYVGTWDNGAFNLHQDGDYAELGVWSVALSAAEIAALAKGAHPHHIRPDKLVLYLPIWGASPEPDLSGNRQNGTVSGTAITDHAPLGPYAPYAVDLSAAVASSAIDLTVADATHAQTAGNAALTQVHQLVVANAAQAQTVQNAALTQVHVLAVANAGHAQTATSPTLTQTHVLTVANAAHAQTADNALLTFPNLTVQDATHAQAAGSPTLSLTAGFLGEAHGQDRAMIGSVSYDS
jgi:hypothetical protein